MTLRVALQMDAIEDVNIAKDSSFALGFEAQKRGHELFHYFPGDLSVYGKTVSAHMRPLKLQEKQGEHYHLGEKQRTNLEEIDVILMRQDPPFDMSYITATYLLERVHPKTFVMNNPGHVRSNPEKILPPEFSDLMPATLISRNLQDILEFRAEHKDIVIKPLYGNGGFGTFRISPDDENINALIEMFQSLNKEPIIAQRYLPEVREGDKRIILVDGKPVGAINRIPPKGDIRANMHIGGTPYQSNLDQNDQRICDAIGPWLQEKEMIFTGIDIIGGKLTEINVTSPTGIQEIRSFEGTNIAGLIWDALENKAR